MHFVASRTTAIKPAPLRVFQRLRNRTSYEFGRLNSGSEENQGLFHNVTKPDRETIRLRRMSAACAHENLADVEQHLHWYWSQNYHPETYRFVEAKLTA